MSNNLQTPDKKYKLNTRQKVIMGTTAAGGVSGLLYLLIKKPSLLLRGLVAGALSTVLDLGVANVGRYLFDAPQTFAPFTLLPILSGGLGGALGATGVYALLLRFSRRPVGTFRLLAGGVLVASFYLPTRLLVSKSSRFAGASMPIILTMMIMHTVVAATSVYVLTRPTRKI